MPEPLPRVGHIDFLNVLPLAYGYAHGGADGLAIERGVPAVLNSDLIAGRLDVSNVSSILYARHADKLRILRGPCVSTDGAVESILLLSRKPIEEIEYDRIALTAKSATSHALLKIILRSGYGAVPTYNVQSLSVEHPIPEDATAALFKQTAESLSLRVPDDLLLAGFDDVSIASLLSPPLTTIRQPCREIGEAAFMALVGRMNDPSLTVREIYLDAPLVVRRSTERAGIVRREKRKGEHPCDGC